MQIITACQRHDNTGHKCEYSTAEDKVVVQITAPQGKRNFSSRYKFVALNIYLADGSSIPYSGAIRELYPAELTVELEFSKSQVYKKYPNAHGCVLEYIFDGNREFLRSMSSGPILF